MTAPNQNSRCHCPVLGKYIVKRDFWFMVLVVLYCYEDLALQ